MLAPNLDVAGNVFLGNEDRAFGLLSPLRRGAMRTARRGSAARASDSRTRRRRRWPA